MHHPNQDVQLLFHSWLVLFQHLQTLLHLFKRALSLSQRLTEKVHFENQIRVRLRRYTGLLRCCSMSRGSFSSMWRGFFRNVAEKVITSIWFMAWVP